MSLDIHLTELQRTSVFDCNVTHNLGAMAAAVGVYEILWRPELNGIKRAGQLIEPLQAAITSLELDPDLYRVHDSPNGWGTYDDFLIWVKVLLGACQEHPTAYVRATR